MHFLLMLCPTVADTVNIVVCVANACGDIRPRIKEIVKCRYVSLYSLIYSILAQHCLYILEHEFNYVFSALVFVINRASYIWKLDA